ncbi:UbiA family prenyltransferase [Streptomyces sp. SP18CS02]|uniref:UbiA family prenyltransferase n=1 Tax=Streptomyces sp. SP18CS02 TaxID=3002531 RepID=UPI002E75CDE2|nr:UbiA family prenyltransferase [Streptomyces sp. SP18CS02]MEE1753773.1 UbiA family prenyltransferase [Streptomyces sp. SP18CS02]
MSGTPLQESARPAEPALAPDPPAGRPPRGTPRELLALTRPYQWVKNLIMVPLPLLHPQVWTGRGVVGLAAAVVVFVLASCVVYIANDIADRERDGRHPVKRHRPLASGRLGVPAAAALGTVLLLALAGLVAVVEPGLAWPVGAYLAINAAYGYGLKHVPVLEVFLVAAGFGLRLVAGYVAVALDTSWWPTLGVFLLAVVVVLGKRRRELELADQAHRPALKGYNAKLLDQLVLLSAGLGVTTLLFFLNSYEPPYGVWAAPLLLPLTLLGLFRYMQLVTVSGGGSDPVLTLVRDPVIVTAAVLNVLIWAGVQAVVHGGMQ